MKNSTVAWLLKAVLVVCACAALVAAGYLLPMFMKHVIWEEPGLRGWYGWIVGFGWLLTVPVLTALGFLWQVFHSIGVGEAFCERNAVRLARVWQLSLFDLVMVCAMGVFLWINQATPFFVLFTLCGLIFLGVAVGITSFALSGLVRNAAQLREENEMTI